MSKKRETTIVSALTEYMGLKNIEEETLDKVMEDSLRNVIARTYGTDQNYDIIVRTQTGDLASPTNSGGW